MNANQALKESTKLLFVAFLGGILGALISTAYNNWSWQGSLWVMGMFVLMIFSLAAFLKLTDKK